MTSTPPPQNPTTPCRLHFHRLPNCNSRCNLGCRWLTSDTRPSLFQNTICPLVGWLGLRANMQCRVSKVQCIPIFSIEPLVGLARYLVDGVFRCKTADVGARPSSAEPTIDSSPAVDMCFSAELSTRMEWMAIISPVSHRSHPLAKVLETLNPPLGTAYIYEYKYPG